MISVALVVRALEMGGAERQLAILAKELQARGYDVHVLSFYADGGLVDDLRHHGVTVWSAHKAGRGDMVGFMFRMLGQLRALRPDVIYGSMPAANILVSIMTRLVGKPRTVWRIASSDMDLSHYDWLSRLSYWIEGRLTGVPDVIVANSEAGRRAIVSRGYPASKVAVIPNGIDTDCFERAPERGRTLRRKWGLDPAKRVIAQIARMDPKKGYEDFVQAAVLLHRKRSDVQFLCVGLEPDNSSMICRPLSMENEFHNVFTCKPMQDDMVSVYSAIDINTLASRFGEGFPNTVAEAMSCGVPCVVTDVGDSAVIVGETGKVVKPRCPEAISEGWQRLLADLDRNEDSLRRAVRTSIKSRFSVDEYVKRTEEILIGPS